MTLDERILRLEKRIAEYDDLFGMSPIGNRDTDIEVLSLFKELRQRRIDNERLKAENRRLRTLLEDDDLR